MQAAVLAVFLLNAAPATTSAAQVELVSAGAADTFADFRAASTLRGRALFTTTEQLAPQDTDTNEDLYRWSGGQPELMSIGPTGGNGAGFGVGAAYISADGERVFFNSWERLTAADTDDRYDVYERAGGQTRLMSVGPTGGNGNRLGYDDAFLVRASADGSRAFFFTSERLTSGDTDPTGRDYYTRQPDFLGGWTTLMTGTSDKEPSVSRISPDGRRALVFTAGREAGGDSDSYGDLYLFQDGGLHLVSTGPVGGNGAFPVSSLDATPDLGRILFWTDEQLTSDDTDTTRDVYEYADGTVSLFSGGPGCPSPCPDTMFYSYTDDGSATFFETAMSLDPADSDLNVDLYRRTSNGYTLMSVNEPGSNCCIDGGFGSVASSRNGDRVVFRTPEYLTADDQDQVDCDSPAGADTCFDLYQRFGGDTELLSGGPPTNLGFNVTFAGASSDARRVFFYTEEPLVPLDTDTSSDLYMRLGGVTSLVSIGTAGGNGPFQVCRPFYCTPPDDVLSDEGNRVFFSTAERLVPEDTDSAADVYMATVAFGYDRPMSATPTYVYLVPAYSACTSPDRTHGPPLAYGSCSTPGQVSQHLTIGTADSNDTPTKFTGNVRYGAVRGDPATPADEADVRFTLRLDDVRNVSDLTDYEGELELRTTVRLTDRASGPTEPATTEDFDFAVPFGCTATTDTTIGSHCAIVTTAEALAPGAVGEGDRSVWQLGQTRVYDGGPDGAAATQNNTLFLVQGVFVP